MDLNDPFAYQSRFQHDDEASLQEESTSTVSLKDNCYIPL
jgi:hypothetical protein